MALVEVIFRDRIGNFTRGQVAVIDSNTPFFKAIIKGGKAEVVNPPDWPAETANPPEEKKDGESDIEQSEVTEPVKVRNNRRSRKKSEESSDEASEYSPERYGESGELAENRDSGDSGSDSSEDSVGRSEYQSYSGGDEGSI